MSEASTSTGKWALTPNDTASETYQFEFGLMAFGDIYQAMMVSVILTLCVIILLVNSLTLVVHCRTKALRNIQCLYVLGSLFTSITVSLVTMLSVAIDRYVYILHPFVYRRTVTSLRVSVLILMQWVLSAGQGYMAAFILNTSDPNLCNPFHALTTAAVRYYLPVMYFASTIVIGVTYGLIARTAQRHHKMKYRRAKQISNVLAKFEKNAVSLKTSPNYQVTLNPCQGISTFSYENSLVDLSTTEDNNINETSKSQKDGDNIYDVETCDDRPSSGTSSLVSDNEDLRQLHATQLTTTPQNQSSNQISISTLNHQNDVIGSSFRDNERRGNQPTQARLDETRAMPALASMVSSLKWLKQMFVVFGLFLCFWTPTMIYSLSSIVISIHYKVGYILAFLGIANSAVNFFVYALMNQQFRTAIKKLFTMGYILAFLGIANSAVNFFVKSEMNQQFRTAIKKLFRSQKRTNSSVLHSRNYSEVRNEPTVPYCNQETIQKSEMNQQFRTAIKKLFKSQK
uniref:G-protein coupled receptors family 1 profile domain-containing protein n=1 Tax=Biomphalaria glabrata TaxID=6526 RepID=A0A2C9LRR0_BIOGL